MIVKGPRKSGMTNSIRKQKNINHTVRQYANHRTYSSPYGSATSRSRLRLIVGVDRWKDDFYHRGKVDADRNW